jgi:hypothetical protein
MAVQKDELQFEVHGNIFQVHGERVYDPENRRPGTLAFQVTNGSGEWIDLIVDAVYPAPGRIWSTGHIGDGSNVTYTESGSQHRNKAMHVTRWRPGLFSIPGNGGGEVFFVVPDDGDVVISLDVTG